MKKILLIIGIMALLALCAFAADRYIEYWDTRQKTYTLDEIVEVQRTVPNNINGTKGHTAYEYVIKQRVFTIEEKLRFLGYEDTQGKLYTENVRLKDNTLSVWSVPIGDRSEKYNYCLPHEIKKGVCNEK